MRKWMFFLVFGVSIWVPFETVFADFLSGEDKVYLRQILRETWRSIDDMTDKDGGIPFDNSAKPNYTSMSNIGLYFACVFGAYHLGWVDRDAAVSRISKGLEFLERMEKWHGFPPSWVQVYHPISMERVVSPVDSAHLAAGLLLARQAFPALEPRVTKLVEVMDWKTFYDSERQALKGGFDLKKGRELDFFYRELGTDLRMAFFLAVATGAAPVSFWDSLERWVEERYGLQYLGPGWRAGGLFLQFMAGLFLDERLTLFGKSGANAAYAQMVHARKKDYPVWGWSCSATPDGAYLGEGKISDSVVTPHASILAVSYYPRKVISNLRALDRYRLRSPFYSNDGPKNFGFRDSVDIDSGKVTEKFLMVDQAMIFLSLVNFLEEGLIWKTFAKDPVAQKGVSLIKDYQATRDLEPAAVYSQRDLLEVGEKPLPLDLGILEPWVKPFYEPSLVRASAGRAGTVVLDGGMEEWKGAQPLTFSLPQALEFGMVRGNADLGCVAYFQWDERYLYLAIEVVDSEMMNRQAPDKIFKEDCVELFMDPQGNGFQWGNVRDFQIGFSPSSSDGKPKVWAWFQSRSPSEKEVMWVVKTFKDEKKTGYRVEAALSWKFLGVQPRSGMVLGVSPAVHDVDSAKLKGAKFNWCYLKGSTVKLGELELEG